MKTSAKAQTMRPGALRGFKVPWLMIHDTPHFTPNRAVNRNNKMKTQLLKPPEPKEAPLPFLQHAHVKFTPDELREISTSIDNAKHKGQLYRVPSKLQQIKMTRFDSAQSPLAMDLEPSTPYLVPTSTKNIELGSSDSLVSLNGDESFAVVETPRTTRTAGAGDYSQFQFEMEGPAVTIDEIKNQVWAHAHRHREASDDGKRAALFMGETGSGAREIPSRGRMKLLRTIHRIADEYSEPMPQHKQPEVLTERSYCAQRLHDYLRQRRIPQPDFLEAPAGMPEYGYGRWRRRRAQSVTH